jgi:hypothetical protein
MLPVFIVIKVGVYDKPFTNTIIAIYFQDYLDVGVWGGPNLEPDPAIANVKIFLGAAVESLSAWVQFTFKRHCVLFGKLHRS